MNKILQISKPCAKSDVTGIFVVWYLDNLQVQVPRCFTQDCNVKVAMMISQVFFAKNVRNLKVEISIETSKASRT
jgi:hypothetical protein